jgi:membrane-anchored protein YejM (alkaline phosphatase superfamily)
MVINILTSPDAMDSIQLGTTPLIAFIMIVISFVVYEIFLIKKLSNTDIHLKELLNKKINKVILLPIFLIIFIEKITYGSLSLLQESQIVTKFKVIPLYQPLTFSRVAAKYFNYEHNEELQNSIQTNALVKYPTSKIKIPNDINKFNIIIIASDSARDSDINEDITPNVELFKKDSVVFNNHYSGGNATRFGIFSIIYGLNSTYWFSFLNANKGPVIFNTLKKIGYNIDIISSTNTSWPEFRQTTYTDIQDSIKDDFKGSPWEKDEQSTNYFIEKIENYSSDKPLFSFVFLDAPHGYSYPDYANKFNATGENVNYLSVSKDSKKNKAIHARYKNSLYFNDLMFAKMIKKLKEKDMYDNSLIIFTSDHGQEFYEYGFFGHNSAFSKAQINSPLIIKLPNSLKSEVKLPEKYPNVLTSHNDIVPTLMSLLGIKNDTSEYSNGYNIFNNDFNRKYVFSANWNNNAVITKENTYVFSNLPNKMFKNEVRDTKTYKKSQENIQLNSKILVEIMNENKRFLK